MADELLSRFGMLCDKLDGYIGGFWDNAEMKRLLPGLKEARYLLQDVGRYRSDDYANTNCLFTDLEDVASAVDDLLDALLQSEVSRRKFDQKLWRVHARLVPLLNSLHKLVADDDEDDDDDDQDAFTEPQRHTTSGLKDQMPGTSKHFFYDFDFW